MIKSDYKAFNMTPKGLIIGLFTHHTFYVVLLYRIGNFFYRHHIKFLPNLFKAMQLRIFACEISPYAKIGSGFRIYHSTGIVIGCDCEIGDNCEIFQNVTLGENSNKRIDGRRRMPHLGNNVSVYAGACIIGPVCIGDNVEIGANSVVTKDIEENSVAAGAPAVIIRKKQEKQ